MKIIKPLGINDSNLLYTNVPEIPPGEYVSTTTYNIGDYVLITSSNLVYVSLQDNNTGNDPETLPDFWAEVGEACPPEYASSTTYSIGDRVIVVATHKVYESLQDSNTGNYPPDNLEGDAPYWMEIGATNPWRAFDACIGSCRAFGYPTIEYEIEPGQIIGGISALNISGVQSCAIVMTDPVEGEVYNETISLTADSNEVYDWYTYFFEDFRLAESFAVTDLPPYGNVTIKVTLTAEEGVTAYIGELVIGSLLDLGFTQYSPEVSIIDYSRKDVDTFGNYTVLERAFSKRVSTRVMIENGKINKVVKTLSQIRAIPVVWIATENDLYEASLTVYGYYKDFSTVIPHPIWAEMNLEIEGLT